MLLTNSHDGRIAIDMRLTTVRVVCQNTQALAMRKDRSSRVFKRAHSISPEKLLADAKEFYRICTAAANGIENEFRVMHAREFTQDQFEQLVSRLLPLPAPPASAASRATRRQYETRLDRIRETRRSLLGVFANGINNGFSVPPAERTIWGALNSVTAFVDHQQKIERRPVRSYSVRQRRLS